MKILHIISSGGMYGAEAVILTASRTLNRGDHQSVLGVFSNSAQPNLQLYDAAAKEGIEAYAIACHGQVDHSVPTAIRDLVRRTKADVVHAHGYKADLYTYLAMRRSHTPIVSTCHGWLDNDAAVRLYGALDRLVLRSYSGVVAVSEEVKRRLLDAGVNKRKICLIRNGIDLHSFAALDRSGTNSPGMAPFKVGLVARLSPEKGVDLFLRAAAAILSEVPLAQFFVVGDGPDRATLESLIEELEIGKSAFLLGRQEDMPSFYASLDVLVLASRQEGLPMALLEGMGSGLPLVATAVGAIPTVVQDGQTGILVAPEDPKALADAVVKLSKDSALRAAYGKAAKELVSREYSSERMTADYLEFYEYAIQHHR